ncbi:K02A2.6-like [Cordylochernes scorpioides]|uniref:K02A2.6-like n=1 Tax=Cordylochernes scorpioides TaxID=51811 RepID=A0ABY6LJQ2_9ARAC|nr:K02A2.6-like [Cordylochernes scorpioides]
MLDDTLSERLLKERDLDLGKALEICKIYEAAKEQVKNIRNSKSSNVEQKQQKGKMHIKLEENLEKYTIDVITAYNKKDWMIRVEIENFEIECKIDTGSQCNIMPIEVFKSLNINKRLDKTSLKLTAYTGHSIKVYGKIELSVVYGLKCFVLEFVVVDGKSILLGLNAAQEMNLIKLFESINQSNYNTKFLL